MKVWKKAISLNELPTGSKGCVKFGDQHIALIHYQDEQWFAVQNICPHEEQNVLSRGIIGDKEGEPKLVCPLHKNAFFLRTGKHLGGDSELDLQTFPVKQEDGYLFVEIEE